MIDTPEGSTNQQQPDSDLTEVRPLTPEAANPAQSDDEKQQPKYHRNYAQYVMRPLKAVGHGFVKAVNWLDAKDGFVAALATVVIAVLTGYYVHYAKQQWGVMKGQLTEMTQQSAISQRQLELSERPWIDATIMLDGPLTWNINGANLPVKVILSNTGHSPALSTNVSPTPLIGAIAKANGYSERNRLCQNAMQVALKNPGVGNALFPSVPPIVQPINIGLGNFTEHTALKDFPNAKFPPDVVLAISIVFCIAYRPSFDDSAAYYTSYIMDLRRTNGSPMFKIGESLKQNQIALYFDPIAAIRVGETKTKP